MAGGSGYGAGPWGDVPWGGATPIELLEDEYCDLFLFEHCTSMLAILTSPIIVATGHPSQFALNYPDPLPPPSTTCDLGLLSGELGNPGFATTNAYITAAPYAGVNDEYTLEVTVFQEELPNNFSDVLNKHFAFGVTNMTGPCASIFVSAGGFAYSGGFHHSPASPAYGDLVMDSALQIIPGTAAEVIVGDYVTYRLSVSGTTGAVYFYATRTSDIPAFGHKLIAVLPTVDASELAFPPSQDRAVVSVRGTTSDSTRVAIDRWCLSSQLVIANLAPVANAGQDQAVRMCSIALLDGSASFDPEGAIILHRWRLIDAPPGSSFLFSGADGKTYPETVPTGFTARFYSTQLADLEAADPIPLDSVLLVGAEPYTIINKGVHTTRGFYVEIAFEVLPDNLSDQLFKLLYQHGITDLETEKPSFYADTPGFYKFDLIVFDGALYSEQSVVILNVLESSLPRNCIPDTRFLFGYLSDFWSLVEGTEVMDAFWSALAQIASTELYTLWQHEYSKSLRDIQRTITRRWLHYDLLLEEPFPELTTIRSIWDGVTSDQIDATIGDPAIDGTALVLSSPLFDDVTVDLTGVVFASELQATLQNELRKTDRRFSVELIAELATAPTFYEVRIDAPFPFTVAAASTVPVFTAGDSNGALSGAGAAGGIRTYVVDRSLQGVDIQEDDVLMVGDVGYRIVRTTDDVAPTTDIYPAQRLVLKEDLPVPAPITWSLGSKAHSEGLDFYRGLAYPGDSAFFEIDLDSDDEPDELIEVTVLGAAEGVPNDLVVDATLLGQHLADADTTVRLAKVIRRTYLPIDVSIEDVPALQEHIVVEDDEATLRRNLDYFLEEYREGSAIRFVSGVAGSDDVWEGQTPPNRLWAEYTHVDNNPTIEANFGIAADFTLDELERLPTEVDYLSAVRGLWYAFNYGPILFSLRVGSQIFLGLPFAEEAGTIVELRRDFSASQGRILVQDQKDSQIIRSYGFPKELELEVNPETGERYAVGDFVAQFAPLVEGVEVVDYRSEPEWFKGAVQQGIMHELQKYHTYAVRVDSVVFDLDALLLAQDLVLKIKPTYTYPMFVVQFEADDIEIDVTDQIQFNGTLRLVDSLCGKHGSTIIDDARPSPPYVAGQPNTAWGGWWNQFDSDDDTQNPPPTFPVFQSVTWAVDKQYLCPDDYLSADLTEHFAAPWVATVDSVLKVDGAVGTSTPFEDTGPYTITLAGHAIPPKYLATAAVDGDMVSARLMITGDGPGAYPTDYEFVIEVNSVEKAVVPFDGADKFIEVPVTLSGIAVLIGDTLAFTVRIPAGSVSTTDRMPLWTNMWARVVIDGDTWNVDDVFPAGTFLDRDRPLV